ncbi:hypothetical protein H072_11588 [Dactylellina haptotyla CBS 200.50]|uniref:Uncharacterized protein n=1 Tax=Dactylellina haptotyla (strain CBS 200.50) TaxID=1284197 RepID=S7ZXS5_DACHA|nr:hypothetical protein H072_11588 [Dactylellina haptotyla CBS 200.50]
MAFTEQDRLEYIARMALNSTPVNSPIYPNPPSPFGLPPNQHPSNLQAANQHLNPQVLPYVPIQQSPRVPSPIIYSQPNIPHGFFQFPNGYVPQMEMQPAMPINPMQYSFPNVFAPPQYQTPQYQTPVPYQPPQHTPYQQPQSPHQPRPPSRHQLQPLPYLHTQPQDYSHHQNLLPTQVPIASQYRVENHPPAHGYGLEFFSPIVPAPGSPFFSINPQSPVPNISPLTTPHLNRPQFNLGIPQVSPPGASSQYPVPLNYLQRQQPILTPDPRLGIFGSHSSTLVPQPVAVPNTPRSQSAGIVSGPRRGLFIPRSPSVLVGPRIITQTPPPLTHPRPSTSRSTILLSSPDRAVRNFPVPDLEMPNKRASSKKTAPETEGGQQPSVPHPEESIAQLAGAFTSSFSSMLQHNVTPSPSPAGPSTPHQGSTKRLRAQSTSTQGDRASPSFSRASPSRSSTRSTPLVSASEDNKKKTATAKRKPKTYKKKRGGQEPSGALGQSSGNKAGNIIYISDTEADGENPPARKDREGIPIDTTIPVIDSTMRNMQSGFRSIPATATASAQDVTSGDSQMEDVQLTSRPAPKAAGPISPARVEYLKEKYTQEARTLGSIKSTELRPEPIPFQLEENVVGPVIGNDMQILEDEAPPSMAPLPKAPPSKDKVATPKRKAPPPKEKSSALKAKILAPGESVSYPEKLATVLKDQAFVVEAPKAPELLKFDIPKTVHKINPKSGAIRTETTFLNSSCPVPEVAAIPSQPPPGQVKNTPQTDKPNHLNISPNAAQSTFNRQENRRPNHPAFTKHLPLSTASWELSKEREDSLMKFTRNDPESSANAELVFRATAPYILDDTLDEFILDHDLDEEPAIGSGGSNFGRCLPEIAQGTRVAQQKGRNRSKSKQAAQKKKEEMPTPKSNIGSSQKGLQDKGKGKASDVAIDPPLENFNTFDLPTDGIVDWDGMFDAFLGLGPEVPDPFEFPSGKVELEGQKGKDHSIGKYEKEPPELAILPKKLPFEALDAELPSFTGSSVVTWLGKLDDPGNPEELGLDDLDAAFEEMWEEQGRPITSNPELEPTTVPEVETRIIGDTTRKIFEDPLKRKSITPVVEAKNKSSTSPLTPMSRMSTPASPYLRADLTMIDLTNEDEPEEESGTTSKEQIVIVEDDIPPPELFEQPPTPETYNAVIDLTGFLSPERNNSKPSQSPRSEFLVEVAIPKIHPPKSPVTPVSRPATRASAQLQSQTANRARHITRSQTVLPQDFDSLSVSSTSSARPKRKTSGSTHHSPGVGTSLGAAEQPAHSSRASTPGSVRSGGGRSTRSNNSARKSAANTSFTTRYHDTRGGLGEDEGEAAGDDDVDMALISSYWFRVFNYFNYGTKVILLWFHDFATFTTFTNTSF